MDGRIRKWDWTGLVSGEGCYIEERVKCAMEGLLLLLLFEYYFIAIFLCFF